MSGQSGDATRRLPALLLALALIVAAGCGARPAGPGDPPLDIFGQVESLTLKPGEEQVVAGIVSRGGQPVRDALVTMNVFQPRGGVRWYIGAPTSAEGKTHVRFPATQTGTYFVELTALSRDEVITMNVSFRVEDE